MQDSAEVSAFLNGLPSAEACRAELERRAGGRFRTLFPDVGPYRRELYSKHTAFIRAGATHRERLFLKANRTGGTVLGAYESVAHATGRYPEWWNGRRFKGAVNIWVAGDTAETTKNILQNELLGPPGQSQLLGTGMIPIDALYHTTPGRIPNAISMAYVRHTSGDLSTIEFKCHPRGSMVRMADGTWQPIEEVALGDEVRRADGTIGQVEQQHAYLAAPVLRLITRSGEIQATPNHQMHTNRGWIEAGQVAAGDVLTLAEPWAVTPRPKGGPGEVVAIEDAGQQTVFCVGVRGAHELVVDGYRVGNSFDQRRPSFQGTQKHVVWLDEEAPDDVYTECLLRTMETGAFEGGIMMLTFTPLLGLTPLVVSFLEDLELEDVKTERLQGAVVV